jgi:hypothetical protein
MQSFWIAEQHTQNGLWGAVFFSVASPTSHLFPVFNFFVEVKKYAALKI